MSSGHWGDGSVIDRVSKVETKIDWLTMHHFPLEQINKVFEIAAGYKDGVIRAMVEI